MWKKTIALATAFAALGVLATVSAQAQSVCSERQTFLSKLGEQFSESPRALGLASNGNVLEVLSSQKGSWSIIVTAPNGTTCLLASGKYWEMVPILASEPAA